VVLCAGATTHPEGADQLSEQCTGADPFRLGRASGGSGSFSLMVSLTRTRALRVTHPLHRVEFSSV